MEKNENSYTQIFIAKIHPRVTERDLKYKFKKYGDIQDVRLKRGYAFIDFENTKDAQEAVNKMNGRDLEGQSIVVQPSSKSGRKEGRRDDENSDNNTTGRRGPQPEDKCFNCEKSGHWANECREPKKSRFPRREIDDIKCYKCGDRGHKQRFCPRNSRRDDSRERRYRRRRSVSKSRSRSSSSSNSRSRSVSRSKARSRSNSGRGRNNRRYRSVSRSDSRDSRRNYRRRIPDNGK